MQRTHNPVERPKTREGDAPTNYHAKIAQPCWEGWLWGTCVWHISAWESANGYWNWHCVPYNPSSRQWMHFLLIVCQPPITVIVSQEVVIFFFCPHCVLVETFKSKSLSPRQSPEPPFRPDSKLTFTLRRTCVCLEPLGSRMNSGFRPGSAAIGKSTVWGWAEVVWQSCYILSPSVILSLECISKRGFQQRRERAVSV